LTTLSGFLLLGVLTQQLSILGEDDSKLKAFVDLLDGDIRVDSEIGEGTVFHVDIPLHINVQKQFRNEFDDSNSQSLFHPVEGVTIDGKTHILIVEDERTNREFMKYTLASRCDVDTTVNGNMAINMARENRYQAIFLDINLGKEMTGIQTMKIIRELPGYQNIAIAAVTANVQKQQKTEFIKAGFSHYLAKPFKRHHLESLLSEMLLHTHG